jgi:hypothetical protein
MMESRPRLLTPVVAVSLDELVPADHFYRHLDRVLDLSFVRALVKDRPKPNLAVSRGKGNKKERPTGLPAERYHLRRAAPHSPARKETMLPRRHACCLCRSRGIAVRFSPFGTGFPRACPSERFVQEMRYPTTPPASAFNERRAMGTHHGSLIAATCVMVQATGRSSSWGRNGNNALPPPQTIPRSSVIPLAPQARLRHRSHVRSSTASWRFGIPPRGIAAHARSQSHPLVPPPLARCAIRMPLATLAPNDREDFAHALPSSISFASSSKR